MQDVDRCSGVDATVTAAALLGHTYVSQHRPRFKSLVSSKRNGSNHPLSRTHTRMSRGWLGKMPMALGNATIAITSHALPQGKKRAVISPARAHRRDAPRIPPLAPRSPGQNLARGPPPTPLCISQPFFNPLLGCSLLALSLLCFVPLRPFLLG